MKIRITFKALRSAELLRDLDPNKVKISVNGETVWDYKDLNGELRLIHERVPGSDKYEPVTLTELLYQEGFQDLPIRSETLDGEISNVELRVLKDSQSYFIDFKI